MRKGKREGVSVERSLRRTLLYYGRGKGTGRRKGEGRKEKRYLPDQCQTASYAPERGVGVPERGSGMERLIPLHTGNEVRQYHFSFMMSSLGVGGKFVEQRAIRV